MRSAVQIGSAAPRKRSHVYEVSFVFVILAEAQKKVGEALRKLSRGTAGILCAVLLALNIYAEHSGRFMIRPVLKLVFAAAFCLFWSLACDPYGRPRSAACRKVWLWGMFIYYIWILSNMLFFDAAFGRDAAAAGINLEPFFTIRNYLRAYENGNIRLGLVVLNLLGNLAAFAPMAVFLPALFRSQRNFLLFTATILFLVTLVELIQLYTGTGSCDIDDLILNTAGALAVWLLVLPWRLLHKEESS